MRTTRHQISYGVIAGIIVHVVCYQNLPGQFSFWRHFDLPKELATAPMTGVWSRTDTIVKNRSMQVDRPAFSGKRMFRNIRNRVRSRAQIWHVG